MSRAKRQVISTKSKKANKSKYVGLDLKTIKKLELVKNKPTFRKARLVR